MGSFRRALAAGVIVTLLVIDWFEFHDLFEPKTIPELLTEIVSVPAIALPALDLIREPARG